jgi:hypothetical protein
MQLGQERRQLQSLLATLMEVSVSPDPAGASFELGLERRMFGIAAIDSDELTTDEVASVTREPDAATVRASAARGVRRTTRHFRV